MLEGYHIEALALHTLTGTFDSYQWNIYRFSDLAYTLAKSLLWHDGSFVDNYLYLNPSTRAEILSRLATARDKSLSAWHATYDGNDDDKKGIEIWRQVFGDKFPAYG